MTGGGDTPGYRKSLWPNDLSEAAPEALPHVKSLAEKYGAEVPLLHALPDVSDYGRWCGEPDPAHVAHLQRHALDGAREKLEEFCQREMTSCASYRIHVVLGSPAGQIVKAVKEQDIDRIVMASRGMRDFKPVGSVAERVVRTAGVPVMIINTA